MITITDPPGVERCQTFFREMIAEQTLGGEKLHTDFNVQFIREQAWKVVPVESVARLPEDDIPRLVSVLRQASSTHCLAIASEDLGELPACYSLSVSDDDFRALNRMWGLFRFLLADSRGLWAISCSEWYNLFAARPDLLERMLGTSIDEARSAFVQFACAIGGDRDNRLLAVAERYSAV